MEVRDAGVSAIDIYTDSPEVADILGEVRVIQELSG